MSEAGTDAPKMRTCKTFKKYTDEYEEQVVAYVREWGQTHDDIVFHEDNSIVKVTATADMIGKLLGVLKERFDYIPPEMREEKKD